MMRFSLGFVVVAVIVIALAAVGGSFLSYTFVRDRASELDSVVELPNPPQLFGGESNSTANDVIPEPTAAGDLDVGAETATEEADAASGAPDEGAVEVAAGDPASDAAEGEDESAADAAPPAAVDESPPPVWDDPRRVTVLMLGIDQRAGEEGTFPTDTMILFSLDPAGATAALLSIPRDLWVDFPGLNQPGRINGANILGDEISYPGGGGPAFAVKTVERNLGVRVNYYVLINFEVFITLVDAIGPIEVCPPEAIDDDHYPDGSYGYISIHFDAGCQELDAERLLQYARTRHGDSDIARSSRQQEVVLAIRDKVLSAGGVTALLPEVPALWESVQNNIRTDLSLNEMISLARKAEQVPDSDIRQGQITFAEVYMDTTPSGDQILVPIATDIRLLIEDLFRPAGTPSQREQSEAAAS